MNYDSVHSAALALEHRFPEEVIGYEIWREFAGSLDSPGAFDAFLDRTASLRSNRAYGKLPGGVTRVFVSHKQQDRDEALRAAWLANKSGHYFWLDILNPVLASGRLNPLQIAAAIEMALLNCTHVLALMTPNSAASRWIPYEYGRAKGPAASAVNAACWIHPLTILPVPEYLHLGPLTHTEPHIDAWLFPPGPSIPWIGTVPPPLP
jgi:hypothetical protein